MYLRIGPAYSDAETQIDKENRLIRGAVIARQGEVKGHGGWFDAESLDALVALGNKGRGGLKTRFAHPGLSSDGMGKQIGRTSALRRDDEIVRGNLQLHRKVDNPNRLGMIQDVLNLAEEDPTAFGMSIVLVRDFDAEQAFAKKHEIKQGEGAVFVSPDKANAKNWPHWRLREVRASDVVDEPAANEGFLSEGEEMAARAESVLAYVTGLTEQMPDEMALGGIPAEKARQFFLSFLDRHELRLSWGDASSCPDCGAETHVHAPDSPSGASLQSGQGDEQSKSPEDNQSAVVAESATTQTDTQAVSIADESAAPAPAATVVAPTVVLAEGLPPPDLITGRPPTDLRAISYRSAHPDGTPLAPKGEAWDGPAQVAAAEVDDLKVMCTWVEEGREEVKGGYKLPHHKAGGEHACVWRGVTAAAARLPRTQMPDADRPAVRAHLGRHYRDFDEIAPWDRMSDAWQIYELGCVQMQLRGGASDLELAELLSMLGFNLEAEALRPEPQEVTLALPAASVATGNGTATARTFDVPEELLAKIVERSVDRTLNQRLGRLG